MPTAPRSVKPVAASTAKAGPQISDALKAKLLGQKKAMSTGIIIDNKTFEKGTFRFLRNPNADDLSLEYFSFYCERIKKGSTSPLTFGLRCPLNDYAENLKLSGTKEEKDAFYNTIKRTHEYWMPVVDINDLGTVQSPNVRILRGKQSVYMAVINRMTDADHGEDVCDLRSGRNAAVSKSGQKLDTVWNTMFLDSSPLTEDEDYLVALENLMSRFDIKSKAYRVDWEALGELYVEVTGQDMPAEYREQEGADAGAGSGDEAVASPAATTTAKASATGIPPKGAAKPATATAAYGPARKAAAPAPEPEPTADENGVTIGVTRAAFELDGVRYVGVITAFNEASCYDFKYEATGEDWTVQPGEFEIVEDEPAAEVEETPAPAPAPKGPQRAAKPAPAPAAVAKPAATPATPAKPAAKPTVAKPASASAGIKARLGGK